MTCVNTSLFQFSGPRAAESGQKINSEAVNDMLVVHGFFIGYKPDYLHAQHIPHGLGGFFLCRGGDMGIGVQGSGYQQSSQVELLTYFFSGIDCLSISL